MDNEEKRKKCVWVSVRERRFSSSISGSGECSTAKMTQRTPHKDVDDSVAGGYIET